MGAVSMAPCPRAQWSAGTCRPARLEMRACVPLSQLRGGAGEPGRGEIRAGKGKRGALKTTFFVLFFGFTRVTTYQ